MKEFEIKTKALKSNERIDLFKYMKNKNDPNGCGDDKNNCWGWGAGLQLEALEFYLSDKVKILKKYMDDDYQGKCFAILKIEDTYIIWRDSFGSCSGCDGLEGENGYEYIKSTLSEGNTLQFKSLSDARDYVVNDQQDNETWGGDWARMPLDMFGITD